MALRLPIDNWRFSSDPNGPDFWSGPNNQRTLPGCTPVTVTAATVLTMIAEVEQPPRIVEVGYG